MTDPDPDAAVVRLHTYVEAAGILRIEESWLRNHVKELPRVKLGGRVFFTDEDLRRIVEMHHCEPETAARPAPVEWRGGDVPHPLAGLKPSRASRRQNRSGRSA